MMRFIPDLLTSSYAAVDTSSTPAANTVSPPSRAPPPRAFVQKLRDEQALPASSTPRSAVQPRPSVPASATTSATTAHNLKFQARVGAKVDKAALETVMNRLTVEARAKFHQQRFEEALNLFRQAAALGDTTLADQAARARVEGGAMEHNIASCLHCLGEFAEAKQYYEAALAAFDPGHNSSRMSRFWNALYGDVDRKRRDFVRERLVDIEFGRKPDLDKYLDGFGVKRDVTPDLAQPPQYTPSGFAAGSAVTYASPLGAGAALYGAGLAAAPPNFAAAR